MAGKVARGIPRVLDLCRKFLTSLPLQVRQLNADLRLHDDLHSFEPFRVRNTPAQSLLPGRGSQAVLGGAGVVIAGVISRLVMLVARVRTLTRLLIISLGPSSIEPVAFARSKRSS